MFCPQCGAEFREGFDRCNECDVSLVREPPAPVSHEAEDYVTVLETSEVASVPLMKTALESAGIPVQTTGEDLMGLFPANTMGAPFHAGGGEVAFRVPVSRAEEARAILETAATVDEASVPGGDAPDVD